MRPRRAQEPITIRSDRAAARLRMHTVDGRSQAEVIEDALDQLPLPRGHDISLEERRVRIMEILDRLATAGLPTMAEFDAEEYDESGNPR